MSRDLPTPGGNYEAVDEGTYLAVCNRVVDLGTQETAFPGQPPKRVRQILISWELPEAPMGDGRPFSINKVFTWSMHEKSTLRKALTSWRGRAFSDEDLRPIAQGGFDIKRCIGTACLIGIVHSTKGERTYANIASFAKLLAGMKAPASTHNEKVFIWLDAEGFDQSAFEKMGDYYRGLIEKSPEYKELKTGVKAKAQADPDYSPDDYDRASDELVDEPAF